MKKLLYVSILALILSACGNETKTETANIEESNMYRGSLQLNDSTKLPFTFKAIYKDKKLIWEIHNANEVITVDEISISGDTISAKMPVFDTEFITTIDDKGNLSGYWYDYSRGDVYSIPFTATIDTESRFDATSKPTYSLSDDWEVHFSPGKDDEYPAIGEFTQEDERITGSFLTETGDYRYLEGVVDGNQLKLSTFDGSHAFYFEAKINDNTTLDGWFYSGNHWSEKWTAKRNTGFKLRDAESLTYLREDYNKLAFTFPNLKGDSISLADEKYTGKVVIVQLFGSWCPNCMDETRYLVDLYNKHHANGLEIVGLAYERSNEFDEAKKAVYRMKDNLSVNYDLLIAGTSRKSQAAETLPMLNAVISFPTAIYIDRKGEIRKIHTGFSGPGTTIYDDFVKENNAFVEELLAKN